MNSLFVLLGMESWKPLVAALVLPPVPLLVLVLVGARLIPVRRGWGWLVLASSTALLWLSMCSGVGRLLQPVLLPVTPPLGAQRIAQLHASPQAKATTAIVVLGGGAEPVAPEYGASNLLHYSLERLRYGLWLARETGLPVAFSGGVGWASRPSESEADIAARIAAQDFKQPLRWTENQSHDTRENAVLSIALMKRAGISHVLLVTHGWHMPRALGNFEQAGRASGISVEPAPMGLAPEPESPVLEWIPGASGYARVRNVLRERIGLLFGA